MVTDQIDVIYKVVTPLFCGGAGSDVAEVRVPSVKGVLRWWWRALAWSRCGGDLGSVHAREAQLFGSARGGQSQVILRHIPGVGPKVVRGGEILRSERQLAGEGARYLGYGVFMMPGAKDYEAGKLSRSCLEPPFEVELALRARGITSDQRALLVDALKALGLLGGFGAKSRKGYGSVVLQSIRVNGAQVWRPPTTVDELEAAIAELIPRGAPSGALPPYTALSPRMRVALVVGRQGQPPLELLDFVGREMMRYRSWGHNGRVLGLEREGRFKDDHDLMKQSPHQRSTHPRRIAFGLPHNYGKYPANQVSPADPEDGDRRASPLLVHVHTCGATPVAVLAFLPAVFLANGSQAKINVGGARVSIARDPEFWQPIHGFLDRFVAPDRKDLVGRAREVRR
jgi:CRISPR-associated protein Cmr1